jgi:hypothetical protein
MQEQQEQNGISTAMGDEVALEREENLLPLESTVAPILLSFKADDDGVGKASEPAAADSSSQNSSKAEEESGKLGKKLPS